MHKFVTLLAVAGLGVVWSVGPVYAADPATTTDKAADKVESTKEKAAEKVQRAEDKAEQSVERAKDKAQRSIDKAEDKAERAADKTADKAEGTKDTLKDKAVRAKDSMKEKAEHVKDKMHAKRDMVSMTDARAAQDALRTNGFDPGPSDGRVGPRTKAAILDYQKKNDLPVTGMLDDATMARLNVRTSRTTDIPSASPTTQPDAKKEKP